MEILVKCYIVYEYFNVGNGLVWGVLCCIVRVCANVLEEPDSFD